MTDPQRLAYMRRTRAQEVVELASALAEEDAVRGLVAYGFSEPGGGWVRPDWQRIAEVAFDHLELKET